VCQTVTRLLYYTSRCFVFCTVFLFSSWLTLHTQVFLYNLSYVSYYYSYYYYKSNNHLTCFVISYRPSLKWIQYANSCKKFFWYPTHHYLQLFVDYHHLDLVARLNKSTIPVLISQRTYNITWRRSIVGNAGLGRWTSLILRQTASWTGDHFVFTPSAIGQPTWPTQPSIPWGSVSDPCN